MATILLQEYLKKYSTISSKFIDDFFSLYDRNTNTDDFVITVIPIKNGTT
jgi:hypothetical protein